MLLQMNFGSFGSVSSRPRRNASFSTALNGFSIREPVRRAFQPGRHPELPWSAQCRFRLLPQRKHEQRASRVHRDVLPAVD